MGNNLEFAFHTTIAWNITTSKQATEPLPKVFWVILAQISLKVAIYIQINPEYLIVCYNDLAAVADIVISK